MNAMLFPGQGSQSVGMLAGHALLSPIVRETFDEVSEESGVDLWALSQEGPEARLGETVVTQPALLAAGVATWRVWQEAGGPEPAALAGHSLGEYCALVASEALSLASAARLVSLRARAMQEAVPIGSGAMAAILKLDDDVVAEVCRAAADGEVVAPANFNAPGQVVIAGTTAAVARAVEGAKAVRGRAIPLSVSVPSHCELMRPAAERLAAALAETEFATPRIPVLHNADVASHDDAEGLRSALQAQLYRPVRWVETIQALRAMGVSRLGECGPGKVLSGLVKRIDRDLEVRPLGEPEELQTVAGQWKGEGA